MKVESTSQDDKEIFMLLNQEIITTEKYLQYGNSSLNGVSDY